MNPTEEHEQIYESAATAEEALAATSKKAAERWGVGNYDLSEAPTQDRNGRFTAVAKYPRG